MQDYDKKNNAVIVSLNANQRRKSWKSYKQTSSLVFPRKSSQKGSMDSSNPTTLPVFVLYTVSLRNPKSCALHGPITSEFVLSRCVELILGHWDRTRIAP